MIETLVSALLFAGGGGFALYLSARRYAERQRAWREAARLAGLTDVRRSATLWSPGGLAASSGAHGVRFESYQRGRGEHYESGTQITIGGDSGLWLRPEVPATTFEKAIGRREIQLGDQRFDDEVYVLGRPRIVRALLDVETRAALRELLGGAVRVEGEHATLGAAVMVSGGDLQAELADSPGGPQPALLAGALRTLLAVARRLEKPDDVAARIAENTVVEPEWRVRLENLRLLVADYPHHGATREALRRGCQDEREDVRLEAAAALKDDEGRRTLLEIASREWSDDSCAARAIIALGSDLPAEQARHVLAHALRTRRSRTAQACLEGLGRARDPACVQSLVKVLAVESGALAVAAARALGVTGAASAEGPLLKALSRGSAEARAAAAAALGRVGSATAVLPLKEAATQDGADAGLRRAARQAVAEVQSRLQGASPGQLSLAEGDEGRLSLADEDPRGQVSLADRGSASRQADQSKNPPKTS